MRVTVGTVVGLVAAGRTRDEILRELQQAFEDVDNAGAAFVRRTRRPDLNDLPRVIDLLAVGGMRQ